MHTVESQTYAVAGCALALFGARSRRGTSNGLRRSTRLVLRMPSLRLLARFSPWPRTGDRDDGGPRAREDDELLRWLDGSLRRWVVSLPGVVERPPFRDKPEL